VAEGVQLSSAQSENCSSLIRSRVLATEAWQHSREPWVWVREFSPSEASFSSSIWTPAPLRLSLGRYFYTFSGSLPLSYFAAGRGTDEALAGQGSGPRVHSGICAALRGPAWLYLNNPRGRIALAFGILVCFMFLGCCPRYQRCRGCLLFWLLVAGRCLPETTCASIDLTARAE